MTEAMLDLADLSLWEEGFPDHVFAELRSTAPVYHQQLTVAVDDRVGREFWVCTKHAEVSRVHRDYETFTATGGPLIQEVDLFAASRRSSTSTRLTTPGGAGSSRRPLPRARWPSSSRAFEHAPISWPAPC